MSAKTGKYVIEGTAAAGQTWTCEGIVIAEFPEILEAAAIAAFDQLTDGKAIFGLPGVGCQGPYQIARFELTMADA